MCPVFRKFKLCYDIGIKSNSSNNSLIRIPNVGMTLVFNQNGPHTEGENSFINRVIRVDSYFSCKLEGKLFSSEVRRELICLNTKTLFRRCSKGTKGKP